MIRDDPAVRRSLRARILLNSGIQFAGKGIAATGGVVLVALLTRYLGVTGFGTYTYVTSYISLFYVLTDLGVQSIAVRDMVRFPDRREVIAGQLLALKTALAIAALLVAVCLITLMPVLNHGRQPLLLPVIAAGLALLAVPISATGGALFQTTVRMTIPALAETASRYVTLFLVGALSLHVILARSAPVQNRLVAVLLASSCGAWVAAGITFWGARRLVSLRLRFHLQTARFMVTDAIPLAVVSVLGIIHYRIDVLILSQMKNMATVGTYGVAAKVLDVSLAGSAIFMGLAFPVLSARIAGDRVLLQRAFQKTLDFMLIAGVGMAVFISVLSTQVIHILGGSQFQGSSGPLAIIAWAIPITFANTVFAHMLVASNLQRRAVPVSIAAIALNVGLNILLIPHLSASAPALVTVITEGVGTLGVAYFMMRHYQFAPSPGSMGRIFLAGTVAAATLSVLQTVSLLLAVPTALLAYAAILVVTRVITFPDLRTIVQRSPED